MSTGRAISASVTMTRRVLGSVFLLRASGDASDSAPACSDVDKRDINIEPTLPGRSVRVLEKSSKNDKRSLRRTADNDGEQDKAFVPARKSVQDDAGTAA